MISSIRGRVAAEAREVEVHRAVKVGVHHLALEAKEGAHLGLETKVEDRLVEASQVQAAVEPLSLYPSPGKRQEERVLRLPTVVGVAR
jgi:hypothetical protein